jgi:transglutaminase-like putative cysteine protease/tetratricopeptide (TPR) repeat protein
VKRSYIPFLTLSLALSLAAQNPQTTSPIDVSGEGAVIERTTTHVRFENDGTGVRQETTTIRIQSEAGVQQYGQLVFGYSSATEKLDVNFVRVRKHNGEVVETPSANAQDFAPEVLESAPMYSDFRQRHITVVGLRPGDALEYRTTMETQTPLAANEFWLEYKFPAYVAVTEARLEVDVPKLRELKLKSPDRKYTTTESGDRVTYTWVVQNVLPDRRKIEPEDIQQKIEELQKPDVQLTTFKDWQQVARWYAKLQGERVVVNDVVQKKAAELTRGATTPREKAQRLYDFVSKDIRYVSLSFGVGRFQPHPANEVLQGSYGDCKDKHTLLSALLRAAGIQSYPVLIGSERKLDEEIPSPSQFDHVITAARIEKDLTFLDSTAEVAPFGLILSQLRDKQALLVAEGAEGGLHKTPPSSPVKNSMSYSLDGTLGEAGALDATVELSATGDTAVPLRSMLRSTSQADWQRIADSLSLAEGGQGEVTKFEVVALDDAYQPLRIRYKYHRDSYVRVPSTDENFFPFPQLAWPAIAKKTKTGEPLNVGPAMEVHHKLHLQFASNYTLTAPQEIRMSRDYGEFSSSYRIANHVLDAERTLILKVDQVPASRRAEVDSLRSVAMNNAAQTMSCSARPAMNAVHAASLPAGTSVQELRKAGTKALQQRDFRTASELLKRVVEQQPSDEDAWDELGRAYAGSDDHSNAVLAFQKQVAVNAYHKRAYDDLGAELQRQGKYEEAINAYGKQLDNNPVDRNARKNHALLLAQMKRDKEALTELQAFAATPPQDLDVDLALAQLYASSGDAEKSRALLSKVIGSSSPVSGSDVFSAAMRNDIDPEATLHDAAEIAGEIGEAFDEGEYNDNPDAALPAMQFLALQWARMGWANVLRGQRLDGIRYLDSAWTLSQSGAIANRLAQIYSKAGDASRAKHYLTLAVASGGSESELSHTELAKLDSSGGIDSGKGRAELLQMRSIKLSATKKANGTAEFLFVFDGTSKPERVEFRKGDSDLRNADDMLRDASYPVAFPDVSSVKIVRRGTLSCQSSSCTLTFAPLDTIGLSPGEYTASSQASNNTRSSAKH